MKVPNTSHSLWIDTVRAAPFPSLNGETAVDVAIVGAGITGITAALYLMREGKSVALIERGRVAEGTSGFTTAHLTEVIDTRYKTLVKDFGLAGARLVLDSSREAISAIQRISIDEDIACGFRLLPGFLFEEGAHREELEAEYEAAQGVGLSVSLTRDVPLPFARTGLRFERQAQFHPREYLIPLAQRLVQRGVSIFEDTVVEAIEAGQPHVVRTPRGTVRANHVIVTAHAPLGRATLQTKLARYQSYALAFATTQSLPDAIFWDTADPYHYIRGQEVGSASLIIVGGEDHKTGQCAETSQCHLRLLDYARSRFDIDSLHFKWSSQVIEPVDGLPYIGPLSPGATIYSATGYSGNGMTFGTLAGRMLVDAIVGRPNRYAELYSPARVKPLAAAKDFVVENADVPLHFLERGMKHLSAPSADSVLPGQGDVVRDGGKLVAMYRDPSGCVHALDPTCPHMGCLVKFNDAERTWDCPCHGSRFNLDGSLLNGPAMRGLERRDPPLAPNRGG